jgi:phage gp37-like protein
MKVGDLVHCPVNLDTGEMFSGDWELAVVITIFKNEPKINVVYVGHSDINHVMGTWFTEEIKMINAS